MFRPPDSSSPPSTPDSRQVSRGNLSNPSTTPAGPPPDTINTSASFTPAGPPPSSVFGSSQLPQSGATGFPSSINAGRANGSSKGNNLFGIPVSAGGSSKPKLFDPPSTSASQKGRFDAPFSFGKIDAGANSQTPGFASSAFTPFPAGEKSPRHTQRIGGSFRAPSSSPPGSDDDGQGNDDDGEYEEDDAMGDEDEDMDAEGDEDDDLDLEDPPRTGAFEEAAGFDNSFLSAYEAPSPKKRAPAKVLDVTKLAKDLYTGKRPLSNEPDGFILKLEQLMGPFPTRLAEYPAAAQNTIHRTVQDLKSILRTYGRATGNFDDADASYYDGIGPSHADSTGLSKASFLGNLLLQLHHPAPYDANPSLSSSTYGVLSPPSPNLVPIPRAIAYYLTTFHDPLKPDYEALLRRYSNSGGLSAAPEFWDILFQRLIRGQFPAVLSLLKNGRFEVAQTAMDDGKSSPGYTGPQLSHVNYAVDRAISLLESCPAVAEDDWDVAGDPWRLFRRRVRQALHELRTFAEGVPDEYDHDEFEASNFGLSSKRSGAQTSFLGTEARKAGSRIPWTIYQNLRSMYNQLLGEHEEIEQTACDWLEASLALALWWDGEEEEEDEESQSGNPNYRRSMVHHSHRPRARPVDVTPLDAYQRKLARSFNEVMANGLDSDVDASAVGDMVLNTSKALDVGAACALVGDVESTIHVLRMWSPAVAAAIVEVAEAADWIGAQGASGTAGGGNGNGVMGAFDKSDLMVLSFGRNQASKNGGAAANGAGGMKDNILCEYAELVAKRKQLRSEDGKIFRAGWEVAMQVLGRIGDEKVAKEKIASLLDGLPLDTVQDVEKILSACARMGLGELGESMAERYATKLLDVPSSTPAPYGDALFFFARAHRRDKVRDVIDFLTAVSLVHSTPFPAQPNLDANLARLCASPREGLTDLAEQDMSAAQLLATYISGYATLRRFYALRDEGIKPGGDSGGKHGSEAGSKRKREARDEQPKRGLKRRRREAGAALVGVVESASDCIKGGLYDPSVDVVVQVDNVLVLLGEALPLLNQENSAFTSKQLTTLLRAMEDFSTAPSSIRAANVDCLRTALKNAHASSEARGSAPNGAAFPAALQKSTSGLSASTQFSLVGSSMLGSVTSGGTGTSGSSVLVDSFKDTESRKRGWDWRKGFGKDAGKDEVVRMLRLSLAREMAKAWVETEGLI
ncbi:hypothetical protein BDY21DRAFT_319422 [Lineolata rhizophorae]|uniref:Nuclear pore complex protein Nup85 n=1 Tax=Lineolata rhizophorae TaxID=578093 RepID=A0A6A6P351_9PEZI|nr:hypothetical protein BDY21DRAFT_319422 [Lineolata rhizophorae]